MVIINELSEISGVYLIELNTFSDERGRFSEVFRKEWFPQRDWHRIQNNRSDSNAGVLRGLHYHHNQVDYWLVLQGTIRAGLVDLRQDSATNRNALTIDIDEKDHKGLFIPAGVAHGFLSLSAVTLFYVVDNYYDGSDEYGVAWNDPEIGLNWGIDNPIISSRDRSAPEVGDIPQSDLP